MFMLLFLLWLHCLFFLFSVSSSQSEHVRQLSVENPVAFFAVVSPTKLEHVGALQNVVFDKAVTNVGSAYEGVSKSFEPQAFSPFR